MPGMPIGIKIVSFLGMAAEGAVPSNLPEIRKFSKALLVE